MLVNKIIQHANSALNDKTAFCLFDDHKVVSEMNHQVNIHFFDTTNYKASQPLQKSSSTSPLLPPFVKHHCVTHLASHYILVNKYMVDKGHIVISSDCPNALQTEPLKKADFEILSIILEEHNRKGIVYYNCGYESGCSQSHKHMQYAPWNNHPLLFEMARGVTFPYRYFTEFVSSYSPDHLQSIYDKLVVRSNWKGSFNFVISQDIAALIPRISSKHQSGVTVNSLGVSGNAFLWHSDSDWVKTHPFTIISDLCVPL